MPPGLPHSPEFGSSTGATARVRPFTRYLFCAGCGGVYYARKSASSKGAHRYYACGRQQLHGPEACDNRASLREDKLIARIQAAVSAVFYDVDGVLDEVSAMVGETLNRTAARRRASRGRS